MIQLTQAEYDKLRKSRDEAQRLRKIVDAVHSWAVCAAIAAVWADANFPHIVKITGPDYAGDGGMTWRSSAAAHASTVGLN